MSECIRKIALLVILLSFSLTIKSQQIEVDGMVYEITSSTSGNMTVQVMAKPTLYSGDITIPDSIIYEGNAYTVTAIRMYAFKNCVDLTSVTTGEK